MLDRVDSTTTIFFFLYRLLSEANEKRFEQAPRKQAKKKPRSHKTDYHFPKPIWPKKKKKVATPDTGKTVKEEE